MHPVTDAETHALCGVMQRHFMHVRLCVVFPHSHRTRFASFTEVRIKLPHRIFSWDCLLVRMRRAMFSPAISVALA